MDIFEHPKFKEAMRLYVEEETKKLDEEMAKDNMDDFEFSDRHKKRMNRLFREQVGIKDRIPYPEIDSRYERIRSSIVRRFLIIEDRIIKAIKNTHLHA